MTSPVRATLAFIGMIAVATPVQAETVRPASEEQCQSLVRLVEDELGLAPIVTQAPFEQVPEIRGESCRLRWIGSGLSSDQTTLVDQFFSQLLDWQPDFLLAADGPDVEVQGFRRGDELIVMSARWQPPEGACKANEPIAECKLAPEDRIWTITIDAMVSKP